MYATDFNAEKPHHWGMASNKKFLRSIGKKINKLRKKQGLSFQELAHRSEIEKSNLVRITTDEQT